MLTCILLFSFLEGNRISFLNQALSYHDLSGFRRCGEMCYNHLVAQMRTCERNPVWTHSQSTVLGELSDSYSRFRLLFFFGYCLCLCRVVGPIPFLLDAFSGKISFYVLWVFPGTFLRTVHVYSSIWESELLRVSIVLWLRQCSLSREPKTAAQENIKTVSPICQHQEQHGRVQEVTIVIWLYVCLFLACH